MLERNICILFQAGGLWVRRASSPAGSRNGGPRSCRVDGARVCVTLAPCRYVSKAGAVQDSCSGRQGSMNCSVCLAGRGRVFVVSRQLNTITCEAVSAAVTLGRSGRQARTASRGQRGAWCCFWLCRSGWRAFGRSVCMAEARCSRTYVWQTMGGIGICFCCSFGRRHTPWIDDPLLDPGAAHRHHAASPRAPSARPAFSLWA